MFKIIIYASIIARLFSTADSMVDNFPKGIRPATDCKATGKGEDYVETINVTRSKRRCKAWSRIADDNVTYAFQSGISGTLLENYRRNPDRSPFGCWCYTSDPKARRDLCPVKDCDRPLGCTVLATKFHSGAATYVMPSWRTRGLEFWLKAWNPDIYEGLIVSLTSMDKSEEYRLTMGDEDNEKLKLTYGGSNSLRKLLKEETFPHLVPAGKWAGYWLRIGPGQIELGHHGVNTPFFEWTASSYSLDHQSVFDPVFLNFGATKDAWMGISFKSFECLVEETSINRESKIYPINLWKEEDSTSYLDLNLRGTGSAIVTLMWTPEFTRSLAVQIDACEKNISLLEYLNPREYKTIAVFNVKDAISDKEWSKYSFRFTEDNLKIYKNGNLLVDWRSLFPLLFYWFSVSAEKGSIKWSANCPTPDVDGEPRDGNWGGWGPWSCSVTCGKGTGRIERKCDHPPPNIFGKDCKGSAAYEGPCNDFPCGEITPGTHKMIRRYLSTRHTSLQVEAKERVEIACNPFAMPLLMKEVRKLNVSWSHNGVKCCRGKFHVVDNYTLVIPRAYEKHSGVYLCAAHQDPNGVPAKIYLEVVSLVVTRNKPTKKIRRGNSLILKCNAAALSYVYGDLSHRWELNGTTWKEYGMGAVEMSTTYRLEKVDDSHSGIWTCIAFQEDFQFKWTTNWISLKVKNAPNFWTELMENVITTPIFGKARNEKNTVFIYFSMIALLVCMITILTVISIKILNKCR